MITAKDITRTFHNGDVETRVLKGVNLTVNKSEFVAIMGKSGAGKSTLMYQLALLDYPTSGSVLVDNTDVTYLTEKQRTAFRLENLGYVFQDYALVPELNATENVMMPMIMLGMNTIDAKNIAHKALDRLGMGHRHGHIPRQLSGGEQQRVSIARAVAQDPSILFADEPTANLDSAASSAVLDIFEELHQDGQTIVMVTHEKEYTNYCDRIIYMEDGKVVSGV